MFSLHLNLQESCLIKQIDFKEAGKKVTASPSLALSLCYRVGVWSSSQKGGGWGWGELFG